MGLASGIADMDRGTLASGVGHAALIVWIAVGGLFSRHDDNPEMAVTEVSLVSSAEFAAIEALSPTAPPPKPSQTDVAVPEAVAPDQAPPAPTAETPPPERAQQTPPPPDPVPDATDPTPPAPEPDPAPQPTAPLSEDPPVTAPTVAERPRERPADRVAPDPTEAPAPDAVPDAAASPAVTPEATPDAAQITPDRPETAAPDAGTVLATEAKKKSDLAPLASSRPRVRPAPRPPAVVASSEIPPDAVSASDVPKDAIADAVAAAAAAMSASSDTPSPAAAPTGPPMTSGEKDALKVAVQACWNVGSLSSEALNTTVTVSVQLAETGIPDAGSIRMTDAVGGSATAARQAYEAARRAIIRCGASGFKLPAEKYGQWKTLELVFDPKNMRMK